MAYSELIKSFNRIRAYMRSFYVYGFRHRGEYDEKSARGYDDERRRVESWLGDYMAFRQDSAGRRFFLSVDSRAVPHNPLYRAFRAKSFTDRDIMLHFHLLDLLEDAGGATLPALMEGLAERLNTFEAGDYPDESTVRRKLAECEKLGLVARQRRGRETLYRRTAESVDLESWRDAIDFFSRPRPWGSSATSAGTSWGRRSRGSASSTTTYSTPWTARCCWRWRRPSAGGGRRCWPWGSEGSPWPP